MKTQIKLSLKNLIKKISIISIIIFVFSFASFPNILFASEIYCSNDALNIDSGYFHTERHTYFTFAGFTYFDIKHNGKITVTDDDRGISSISPGGYLKISKKTFGNKRTILIESNSKGEIQYYYNEGRREVPYEPEGRIWLEDILLEVIRSTGIDAEGRTKRFFNKGGVDAVLNEISHLSSNSVKAEYFEVLLTEKLNTNEIVDIAIDINRQISSNTSCGILYKDFSDVFLVNETTAKAYFKGISGLSSNTEISGILRHALIYHELSNDMLISLLNCAGKMSSNTETGYVLNKVNPIFPNDNNVSDAYFSVIDGMTSNTEIASVLSDLIKEKELSKYSIFSLLESLRHLSSNTETASVLKKVNYLFIDDKEISEAYFRVINNMSSNTEIASVLTDLLNKKDLSDNIMTSLLGEVSLLSSNTETARVMLMVNDSFRKSQGFYISYFNVIKKMTSNTEAGKILRDLVRKHPLDKQSQILFLDATSSLSSNTETSSVLRAIIPQLIQDNNVIDEFFRTLNRMSSNTEIGYVLRDFIESHRLSNYEIVKILESVEKLSSNTEASSVLIKLSEILPKDDDRIIDAYQDAANSLTSDSEYRRVMDALNQRLRTKSVFK
ncbi:MAG: hypothetical protein JEY97_14470 [Bacteroidales bacterium]|nr:hypothetical protein [Bacteroidales bacterium]